MVSDPDQMQKVLKEFKDMPEQKTTLMKILGEDRKRIEVFRRNDLIADNNQLDLALGVDQMPVLMQLLVTGEKRSA